MLMCVVMFITSPGTSVFVYAGNSAEELFEDEAEIFSESLKEEACTGEDLLSAYMLKEAETVIYESEEFVTEEAAASVIERGSLLTGNEKTCYDVLREQCIKIAEGKISDSKIYIPVPDSLLKDYTAEMLGVESVYKNGAVSEEAKTAMRSKLDVDMKKVVRSLLMDMPYELYWFDKVSGYSMARCVSYKYKNDEGVESISFAPSSAYQLPAWRFSLAVSESYRAAGDDKYAFNTDLAIKAKAAAQKAAADVLTVADSVSSDYAKLKTYKNILQEYSEYNYTAVSTSDYPYGDPWQMIYVFDEDPSTKVVCEGFSKAFKFMCDLSSFAGDIECYLVSGFLGGPSGKHMWNNVRMEDGKIYLVDVTNSRSATAVNFLGGAEHRPLQTISVNSSADGKYTTSAYVCGSKYYYDKLTMNLYNGSVLSYNSASYDPASARTACKVVLSMNYEEGGRQIVSVYEGEDARSKLLAITPVRAGYAFKGWYTLSVGGEALWDQSELIVDDDTNVLYAHWELLPRYEVNAYSGKGIFADGSENRKAQMYEGLLYYETFELPVCDHYTFTGWYGNESLSANSLIKEDDVFDASGPRNIYAGWQLKKYRLTLYPNGGEFKGGSTLGKILTYNALSKLPNPGKYTPTKAGYIFAGWFTERDGGVEYDISLPIEGDQTVYAHWTEENIEQDPVIDDPDDTPSNNKPSTPSENRADNNDTVSVNGFYARFVSDVMHQDELGNWHIVYTGEKLKPEVQVYDNRQLLTEGVDYSLRYVNNLNSLEVSGRTAYAEIRGKGSMKGSYRLNFIIDRQSLEKVTVGNLAVRAGKEAKASPALMYMGRMLKKDKDYMLEIKAGTAELKGTGNFAESISRSLKVQSPDEYASGSIRVRLRPAAHVYNGSAHTLDQGSELIVTGRDGTNADVEVSYSSNVNAGVVKLTVCGKGAYHGVVKKSFRIKPLKSEGLSGFEVSYDRSVRYQKGGARAKVRSISCIATGELLKEGRDVKLMYQKYKKSGKAAIRLKFLGNYKGSSYPLLDYQIEKPDLGKAEVYAGNRSFTKPGVYKPAVAVICDGSLVESKEYSVDYPEMIRVSGPMQNIPVSVSTKEKNYTGYSESVSFNVSASGIDISSAKVVFKDGARDQKYMGAGERITLVPGREFAVKVNKYLTISDAAEIDRNFTIIYTDNDKKGTAYMLLIPKTEKYTGLTKAAFRIKAAPIPELID